MKTKKTRPATKTYTVRHGVELCLTFEEFGLERFTGLGWIKANDPLEAKLLDGEDGEYACWDATVYFVKDGLRISGMSQPSGGGYGVVILVPQDKILKIETY